MRQTEVVKIQMDDRTTREFTVYEARPRDLLEKIMGEGQDLDASFRDLLARDLLPMLTSASMADLEELYPSDVERLFEALKRVNAPLLRGLRAAGKADLGPVWGILKSSIARDLLAFVADLSRRATPAASTTDGDFSSLPPGSSSETKTD